MSKKLKVFRLSLSKWLRGNSRNMRKAGSSMLFDSFTETMCCMGMFGMQCGVQLSAMERVLLPVDVEPKQLKGDFVHLASDDLDEMEMVDGIAAINDDEETDDEQKIAALRPPFRKLGYRIEVVP